MTSRGEASWGDLLIRGSPCSFWLFKISRAPCWWRKTRTYWQVDFFSHTDFHHKQKSRCRSEAETMQGTVGCISASCVQSTGHAQEGHGVTKAGGGGAETPHFSPMSLFLTLTLKFMFTLKNSHFSHHWSFFVTSSLC